LEKHRYRQVGSRTFPNRRANKVFTFHVRPPACNTRARVGGNGNRKWLY